MLVKNLSGSTMYFPMNYTAQPGVQIGIPDSDWAFISLDQTVKTWLNAGLIELNGTVPDPEIPVIPAPEGGIVGRLVVLEDQAAYDAIEAPRDDTLYIWPEA